jgi:hypothetical protein
MVKENQQQNFLQENQKIRCYVLGILCHDIFTGTSKKHMSSTISPLFFIFVKFKNTTSFFNIHEYKNIASLLISVKVKNTASFYYPESSRMPPLALNFLEVQKYCGSF